MIRLEDLPNPQRRAIDLVREVATDKQCRPFLVGGPVRDLLLGRHDVVDVDITLEHDSSTFARALAKHIGGRVRSFPQFLTYKVTADGLPEIDVATARTEKYRKPGALPTVAPGRLADDLLRRDFSINAIAVDILGGRVHDPANGIGDIESKQIRVLHDQSFADDPTRIYRALRLAARLGFALDPHTAALMRAAIAGGALATISKERIWRELFLTMDEAEAPRALAALAEAGGLDALFENVGRASARPDGLKPVLHERLVDMKQVIDADPALDRYVLYTAALLHGNASPVDLEGSGFSQKRARNVMQVANELPRYADALADAPSDRQRFRILKAATPETLSLLGTMHPPHVDKYRDYAKFSLALRGNELEVAPGPHVAKALERTREAVFTGEVKPEEARAFAREMAMKYLSRE
jgi:tRNA nucleotidyltransferase (CCA-adding enzyme)